MVGVEVSLLTKFQSSTVGRNFEHGNFKPLKLYFHRLQPIISQPGDTDNLQSSRLKAQRLASRATDRKVGGLSHRHDQRVSVILGTGITRFGHIKKKYQDTTD